MSSNNRNGGGFLSQVRGVFSIGSTIERMNSGYAGMVNYRPCPIEAFFESSYGAKNTVISGGSYALRGRGVLSFVSNAVNDNYSIIFLHQGSNDIAKRIINNYSVIKKCYEVSSTSPCYEPFYKMSGSEISEIILDNAPSSYDLKYNVKYYIEGIVDVLNRNGKKPSFNLIATCPHAQLMDRVDSMVLQGQISDIEGQDIKSKLMIGQSESYKLEGYIYSLSKQIQSIMYRSKRGYIATNIRRSVEENGIITIDIGSATNELLIDLLISELKDELTKGKRIALVVDSLPISGNEKLKNFIKTMNGQVSFMMTAEDIVSMSGGDEQLFTTIVGMMQRIIVMSHNSATSAMKWSQVFGEHDKQEHSYSVSHGKTYNSILSVTPNYNRQDNYNWKREFLVKPEMIMNLSDNEAFIYSSYQNELSHTYFSD